MASSSKNTSKNSPSNTSSNTSSNTAKSSANSSANRNLVWDFPFAERTKPNGFHSAGLDHFSGSRDAGLFRESLQNSLDADDGKEAVLVEIKMMDLGVEEIGGASLAEALEKCIKSKYNEEEGKKQFASAKELLNASTIPTLSITDLETKGASDIEEEGKVSQWEAMTNSEGHSVKPSSTSLGSFGLGKHAPFVVTPLRTVLYSTCYQNNGDLERRFIGRAILVTHYDHQEKQLSADGYLGEEGRALEDKQIPSTFKLKNPGTKLLIPGYNGDKDDNGLAWDQRALNAAADSFFYAIINKRLELLIERSSGAEDKDAEVRSIEDFVVTADSLHEGCEYWDKIKKATTKNYIKVAGSKPNEKTEIDGIGKVSLHIQVGERHLRRSLALVRHPGLMLTDVADHLGDANPSIPRHWKNFTAVVYCESRDENKDRVLRDCETPSHDRLSIDQIDPTNKERRDVARKALKTLQKWLFENIQRYADPPRAGVGDTIKELEEVGLVIDDPDAGEKITMSPLSVVRRAPSSNKIYEATEEETEDEDEDGTDNPVPDSGEGSGGTEEGTRTTIKRTSTEIAPRFEMQTIFNPVEAGGGGTRLTKCRLHSYCHLTPRMGLVVIYHWSCGQSRKMKK